MSSQLQVTGEAKIRDIQGPVVANSGVITALDGAASQYVRGDGTLADFPTSSGGGSSVSYYLNSSVSQGTIGGVAYRELSKDPIIGAGTDIAISSNGYVANYITDVNDPDVTIVPGGNFNCEFYFSVNNNTGNPTTYAELYKYDGTTFTLLGSNVGVPESINQGTTIAPYYFAIPVATASLALTDRLAIRIYVNVSGRTVTLHTENGHLCQVVTTLSKGMVSLNNLTDQSQFLTTGTAGTNFTIASTGDTHTFNLPIASATNTGKLSSTDWSTFNNKVPYTGATGDVDLGVHDLTATGITANSFYAQGNGTQGGYLYLKQGIVPYGTLAGSNSISADGTKYIYLSDAGSNNSKTAIFELGSLTNNTNRTFTLPDLSGTLALLEGSQTFSGLKTFDLGLLLKEGVIPSSVGYTGLSGDADGLVITKRVGSTAYTNLLYFNSATSNTYTFPASSGTIALTSNLSSYVPYTGATTDLSLGNNTLLSMFVFIEGNGTSGGILSFKQYSTSFQSTSNHTNIFATDTDKISFNFHEVGAGRQFTFNVSSITAGATRTYTMPDANGTIALLSGTQTFTGATTFSSNITVNSVQVGNAGNGSNVKLGGSTLGAITTGSNNIAIGTSALTSLTTSNANIGIGNSALASVVDGAFNTAIGFGIGASITSGSNNSLFGYGAGSSITTGNYNTIIGGYAGTAAMSNNIVLADGQGNIRYQWNGTNNVFGNPISGTSATFSSSVTATGAKSQFIANGGNSAGAGISLNTTLTTSPTLRRNWGIFTEDQVEGDFAIKCSTAAGGDANLGISRLSILSNGNVGIGTSSPVGKLDVTLVNTRRFIVTYDDSIITIKGASDTGAGENLRIIGDNVIFNSGSVGSGTERMRITSGGNVLIGTTSALQSSEKLAVTSDSNTAIMAKFTGGSENGWASKFWNNGTSGNNLLVEFLTESSITSRGSVTYNRASGLILYNTTSDYRLKTQICDFNALNIISNLKPKEFRIGNAEKKSIGFIAHELQEYLPQAVNGEKDAIDKDGNPIYQSVDYSQLTGLLVKAIQELKAEIDELKNK